MKPSKHNQAFRVQLRQLCREAGIPSQEDLYARTRLSPSTIKAVKQGVCSTETRDIIVGIISGALSPMRAHLAKRLFDTWEEKPAAPGGAQRGTTRSTKTIAKVPRFKLDDVPDLLTPGFSTEKKLTFYTKHLGSQLGAILTARSSDIIGAVEDGDFHKQAVLGLEIARDTAEFPVIQAVGYYLAGEGFRLQGDMAHGPGERDTLYKRAIDEYQKSVVLNAGDPRPVRGIGRIQERGDRLDPATRSFERAQGIALVRRSTLIDGAPAALFLGHEYLRIIRHKIHCVLDLREKSAANAWNSEAKASELEGMVTHCENAHFELMESFKAQTKWWRIEWFMGMVFLAKAWGHLRRADRMHLALLKALDERRLMIASAVILSKVERANLQWWCEVTLGGKKILPGPFVKQAEGLQVMLRPDADPAALRKVDEILQSMRHFRH